MLQITKIVRFEMAHAIHGYAGGCKNIHGHSYILHVTVTAPQQKEGYVKAPGYLLDFKDLKRIITAEVVKPFDHMLVLSKAFIEENEAIKNQDNLFVFDAEPTAENLLVYIQQALQLKMPDKIKLNQLKLYETSDSYAVWTNDDVAY